MRLTAIIGLVLVLVLVALSSYLRLDHSGIGCTPWPDCYGNIGQPESNTSVTDAYERLVIEARQPMSWARPMHRLVASVLGLLVLGLTGLSIIRKKNRLLSFLLLGFTVFLAWLGIYSEGLHSPAVVMGNLLGGFVMVGLFAWLVFAPATPTASESKKLKLILGAAIVLLGMQIVFGGFTSANFAAASCQSFPHCHGQWVPDSTVMGAFDLSRSVVVNETGFVVGGDERAAVHQLHRLFAVLTVFAVLFACAMVYQDNKALRGNALVVAVLIFLELVVGVAAVKTDIPISAAVAHNWLAALLLISLLRMRARLP